MKPVTLIKRSVCIALAAFLLCTGTVPYTPAVYAQEGTAQAGDDLQEQELPLLPQDSESGEAVLPADDGQVQDETTVEKEEDEPAAVPAEQEVLSETPSAAQVVTGNVNTTPGAVVTEAPGVNLVNNPGFEAANTLDAWGQNLVSEQTQPEFAHSGAKCVVVNAGLGQVAYAFSGLNASYDRSAAVTAGMWVNLADPADAEKVTIVLERKTADNTGAFNLTAKPAAQTGWQKVEFTGAAMDAACTEQVIKFEVQSGNTGDIYFDDAYVCTENQESIQWLRNAGFEEGQNAWSANLTVDGGRSGKAFSLPDGTDLYQASGWWGVSAPAYNGSEAMQFSVWAKSDTAGAKLTLRAELKEGKGDISQEFALTTDWKQYVLDVPAAEGVTEALFHLTATGGAVLVDDASFTLPQAPVEPEPPEGESKEPGVVVTGAPGLNLVNNPGFEVANTLDTWGQNLVSEQTQPDLTHSGAKCAVVNPGQPQTAYAFSSVTAGYDRDGAVTAGMWVNLADPADAEKVTIVLERKIGADNTGAYNLTAKPAARTGWQKVELTGAAMDVACTEQVIKFEVQSGNAGAVYFDDVYVCTENEESIQWLRNPSFEGSGSWSTENFVQNDAGRTGKALELGDGKTVYQASGWWGVSAPAYNGSEAMQFSVWAKSETAGAKLTLRAELKEGKGDISQEFALTTDWKQYVLDVPAAEGVTEALFHLTAAGGTVLVDDAAFTLPQTPVEPPYEPIPSGKDKTAGAVAVTAEDGNVLQNPGFESGADSWGITPAEGAAVNSTDTTRTYMGAGSVIVSGEAHLWNNLPGTVDGGAEAAVNAWVYLEKAEDASKIHLKYKRVEDGVEKVYEADAFTGAEGWQQVSLTVPEYPDATAPVLLLDVDGGLAGKIYLDDFSIVVKEAEPEPTPDPIPSDEDKTEGTVVTGQPDDNLVQNPGFEEKNDSGDHGVNWGLVNGAAINTDTDYAHSGAFSVVCGTHENGSSVFNVLPATQDANAATTVSAWVYLEYPEDAAKVQLKLKRIDAEGADVVIYDAPAFTGKAGWQMVTLEVPERTEADSAQLVVVVDVAAGAKGRVFLDDFYVKKVEKAPSYAEGYLTNPGLDRVNEAGTEVNNWGLTPGWDTVADAVCSDVVHTAGGHSVRIPQADVQRELIQSSAWTDPMLTKPTDPSKPMLLTVWVKYENITGDGIWLRSERKQGSTAKTAQSKRLTGTSNGWEKLELYIAPNEGGFDECIVGLAVAPGSGTVWVDDFRLEETTYREPTPEELKGSTETAQRLYGADALQTGANWLTNPGFEQGMLDWGSIGSAVVTGEEVHGGSNAMRLMGEAHLWNNVATDVDKDLGFRLSFWVCLSAPSDAQYVEFYVDRKDSGDELIRRYAAYPEAVAGWQQIVIDIPAEDYFETAALVVGMDARARLDPVYLDDFYLTKTEHNPSLDNYIANWSYEQRDGGREKWGTIPAWGEGVNVASGQGHSGDRALQLTLSPDKTLSVFQSNSWGGAQQYKADENMILSVFLRTEGITGDGVLLKAERKNGDALVGEPLLSERVTGSWNGWTLLELYIPATDEPVSDIVVTLEAAPGTGVLYADSWGLYPTDLPAPAGTGTAGEQIDGALLKNGGMEQLNPDGTVTHWDVWPGTPEEGQRKSYSTTDIKHSGERAVCIELVYSNPQAIYQYRLPNDNPFPFDEDYVFSAWVKMDAVSVVDGNGVKIGVKRKGADGKEYNVYQSVPMGTSDWTKVELEVPKEPGVEIVQYDVIFDIGCGSGKIYFDDMELTPAELESTQPSVSFQEVEFTPGQAQPAGGEGAALRPQSVALLAGSGVALCCAVVIGAAAVARAKKRRS